MIRTRRNNFLSLAQVIFSDDEDEFFIPAEAHDEAEAINSTNSTTTTTTTTFVQIKQNSLDSDSTEHSSDSDTDEDKDNAAETLGFHFDKVFMRFKIITFYN